MNEFEEKDYESARNYADSIKANAENIMNVFNNINSAMSTLYGESWQSRGADVSNGRYQEIKSNYEIFYENVLKMKEHIYTVTARNEEADQSVSSSISEV